MLACLSGLLNEENLANRILTMIFVFLFFFKVVNINQHVWHNQLIGWAKTKLEDVKPTHVPRMVDRNSLKVGLHSLGIHFQDSTSTQSCKNIKFVQHYMIKFKFGLIPKINPKKEEEAKVYRCWHM